MKKVLSFILSIIMLLCITLEINIFAYAIGNYGVDINSSSYTSNDNPFTKKGYWGQCTWYCWGRAKENGTSLWWGSESYGNAKDWYANAAKYYRCDQNPSANSIMVSPDGRAGNTIVGHVMFVEKVENGYAYITEANYLGNDATVISWNGNTGRYHEDIINLGNNRRKNGSTINITGYIHLKCDNHTWDKGTVTTERTCKKDGVKTYTCTVCGDTKTEVIPKGHKYKVIKKDKANLLRNGVELKKCKYCKKQVKSTIYRPKTIKLKKTVYVYNGNYREPSVIIKDTKNNEIPSNYYDVNYKNNKNVGPSSATVEFKGNYSGKKKLVFGIIPKDTQITNITQGVKAFTVTWEPHTEQITGYQIQYSTNKKFKNAKTVKVNTNTVFEKTVENLKGNKKYYVRVRTYKKNKSVAYYSKWSKTRKIKTLATATWVKPFNYQVKNGGNGKDYFVAEKVGNYYYCLEENYLGDFTDEYCFKKYSTENTLAKKINFGNSTLSNQWKITGFITDGCDNVYYCKRINNNGSFKGTIYKLSPGGNVKRIFSATGMSDITGIYGGYIYYLKVIIIKDANGDAIARTDFCKYNLKTKKSSVIYKNTPNLEINTATNGRYMLFEGATNDASNVPISVYDAKTGKVYKITNKGRCSGFSNGKVYYMTRAEFNIEQNMIFCCNINGKNKKTVASLDSSYWPLATSGNFMYLKKDNSDYAYMFKTNRIVKVVTAGKQIIDLKE